MPHSKEENPHRYLDFTEACIISTTYATAGSEKNLNKESFLKRFSELLANTTDPLLLRDIQSVRNKLSQLDEEQFAILLQDARPDGNLLFPPNYELPHFSDFSL